MKRLTSLSDDWGRTAVITLRWAPVALAGLYLLVLLIDQSSIRASLNSQADFASAPMIAQLLGEAPAHSVTTLGDYAWYEALWLLIGTKWMPHHFFVWQLLPFVIWIATTVVVGLSVKRIAGRAAGATTAAMVICGGIVFRSTLWSLNTHGPLALHTALIGFCLLIWVARPTWAAGWRGLIIAIVLGLVSGLGATDPLLLPIGIGSLLATTLLLWVRRGLSQPFALAVITAAITVIFSRFLIGLAHDAHITWTMHQVLFAAGDGVSRNLGVFFTAIIALVANDPVGQKLVATPAISMAGGIVAFLGAGAVLRFAGRDVIRFGRTGMAPAAVGEGAAEASLVDEARAVEQAASAGRAPADPVDDIESALWIALVAFWLLVAIGTALAFILTTSPVNELSGRYLAGGWIGIAVLLPVLGARHGHAVAASVLATAICAAATYGFVSAPQPGDGRNYPTPEIASAIRKYAADEHVVRGYAGFWDAMPITWHTRFATRVYPIEACPTDETVNCSFYEHQISSWYDPEPGNSMLITDVTQPLQPIVDRRYGVPISRRQWGPYWVYVYDHDISTQIVH